MLLLSGFVLLVVTLSACSLEEELQEEESSLKLNLIQSMDLEVPEPSGLTLNEDGTVLYTVSDPPDNRVYELDLEGNVINTLSYEGTDLEGITFDLRDGSLWVVEESLYEIVHLDTSGMELGRYAIDFSGSPGSGFEGITLVGNQFYVLNETLPGVLLEIDSLFQVVVTNVLSFAIDYSGICLNDSTGELMIVSHESQELYVLNSLSDVPQSASLDIVQAEGLDYDSKSNILYIVSDSEEKLYVYEFIE